MSFIDLIKITIYGLLIMIWIILVILYSYAKFTGKDVRIG